MRALSALGGLVAACPIALCLFLYGSLLPAQAQGLAAITLTATPSVIMADGQSTTIITAQAGSISGHPIADGTLVRFTTTSGTLSAPSAATSAGVARVTLTSSPLAGTAVITASFVGSGGGASGQVEVEFTQDKELANTDRGEEDWIRVSSKEYLEYSADYRVVDAASSKRGTHFSYRGITIDADAMQVDLDKQQVLARNAIVRKPGCQTIDAALFSYSLLSHVGNAVVTDVPGQRTVGNVTISGSELAIKPLATGDQSTPSDSTYNFVDVSQSRVLVVASSVAVRPGDTIQFKHATIYVDNKKMVSMAYHVMPLSTDQIFGQQVLGYGTDGFFLNVPYYFSVSPHSTGTFYLRSPAASLENGTFDSGGGNGLSLDMDESYGTSSGNSHGDFQLLGLNQGNWGARWTHSQAFNSTTRAYFYVDAPEHKGLLASTSLTHQFTQSSFNFSLSDSRSPADGGYSSDNRTISANLQTDPRLFLGTHRMGLNYVALLSAENSQETIHIPKGGTINSQVATRGAGLRFFTPNITPDRRTTITDSFDFEQDYSETNQRSALVMQANLSAIERLTPTTSATLAYSFSHNPFLAQPHIASLPNAVLLLLNPVDQQNVSLSFISSRPNGLWSLDVTTTYELPNQSESLGTALNYRLSPVWHVGVNDYIDRLGVFSYQDVDLSVARRIGSRDLVLYWSTLEHRFRFNIAAAQL